MTYLTRVRSPSCAATRIRKKRKRKPRDWKKRKKNRMSRNRGTNKDWEEKNIEEEMFTNPSAVVKASQSGVVVMVS
jgi:hypothetical protein